MTEQPGAPQVERFEVSRPVHASPAEVLERYRGASDFPVVPVDALRAGVGRRARTQRAG